MYTWERGRVPPFPGRVFCALRLKMEPELSG